MDITDTSLLDSKDTTGLPQKAAETWYCNNCNEPIDDNNGSISCRGCNLLGCEKCMTKQPDYDVWLCKTEKKEVCQVECFCEFLETLLTQQKKEHIEMALNYLTKTRKIAKIREYADSIGSNYPPAAQEAKINIISILDKK